MRQRILIIGCSGSGKSTLARQLGQKLKLPVIHLDQLYWAENWQAVTEEVFDTRLEEALGQKAWIIDGNFSRTLAHRLQACDTVIYLDFSRWTCLRGAIKRVLQNYGRTRADMAPNCPEKWDLVFLKWIWQFNKKHRKKYRMLLQQARGVEVIRLENRQQVKVFIKTLA